MSNDEERTYQMVILGKGGVGKSSLCLRFTQDTFPEEHSETPWVDT
jgi:GTPase SAR1 family protein